jgi:hypothetical protein
MAAISIRDMLGVEIVSANPNVTTGFGKYLKGKPAQLLAAADVASQLRGDLAVATPGEGGFRLSLSEDVPLEGNGATLTIDAAASATLGVYNRTGMQLLENTFLGKPLNVAAGQAFVALSVRPTLTAGGNGRVGDLSFGMSVGSESEWRCYRPFDTTGPSMRLSDAAKELLEHFVIPNDASDLKQMQQLPSGTLACISGHGQLRIAASANVVAAFNPLASVDTLPKLGKLHVSGGASASVGVAATLTGEYQIRAHKVGDATVRLGFHTLRGREFEVTLSGTAGPGVSLGERDLLAMLFKGPGGISVEHREDLVQAGITSQQLDRVVAAMKGGLSRKLEVAINARLASLREDEAAFLYDIDLDTLDGAGADAIDQALTGNLTALNALEPELPAHGITLLQSQTDVLRKKSVKWRINLLGIINVLSMSELVRTGSVLHDEESGELLITDKVTSDRVGAIVAPKHIRKLLYESTMMTLTYKASGLDVNSDLAASQSFFFFDKNANRQRLSDFLDAVVALQLIDGGSAADLLKGVDDFGKSSLVLETTFNKAACERVFQPAGGSPGRDAYESIGKRALLALVKPSDPDAYRRIPLENEALWRRLKDAGQPSFRFVLPPPITGGAEEALRVTVVAADYSVIAWWAQAMAAAMERLADMATFLAGRQPTALDKDPQFQKRRSDLEDAVTKAIRRNTATFDDPWGLVALFMASAGTAEAAASIISPKLTLFLPE